jgi:hypothetical protein
LYVNEEGDGKNVSATCEKADDQIAVCAVERLGKQDGEIKTAVCGTSEILKTVCCEINDQRQNVVERMSVACTGKPA